MSAGATVSSLYLFHLARVAQSLGLSLADETNELKRGAPPELHVPAELLYRTWERIASRSDDLPSLALGAARIEADDHHSPLYLNARYQPTVGAAMEAFRTSWAAINTAYVWKRIDEADRILLVAVGAPVDRLGARLALEFDVADAVLTGRRSSGGAWTPLAVMLQHDGAHDRLWSEILDCEVESGTARTALVFRPSDLDIPIPSADASITRAAERVLDRLVRDVAAPADVQVRAFLYALESIVPSVESAAKHVGVSPRSLQRRLGERGTSFRVLLDERNRELALRWVADRPIKEIAYRLGFASPRAFHRAFRRWTGSTPAEWRERKP